jgi:Tfp pilus assembly protein PilZ
VSERTIQIRFDSPDELRAEFEKNIANRGIFVATEDAFDVREKVRVEIVLGYEDAGGAGLALSGEVVHRIPVGMAASGALPGVAVQFDDSPADLQAAFAPLLEEPPPAPDKDTSAKGRRTSKRGAVRVPIRVMPTRSPPFETRSRDLSATGILLSTKDCAIPVGEVVRIGLWHPKGDPSVEIDGKVVREVRNRSGRVAAVAVAFDRRQARDPETAGVIEALRQVGHRSRLGGINGAIADMPLPNLLQMVGSSSPQGTVVVERHGEQGWITFADGQLIRAELGLATGHDALVEMLGWPEGHFQFEASIDPQTISGAAPEPLEGAIMRAICAIDERARPPGAPGAPGAPDAPDATQVMSEGPAAAIGATTTFEIDDERERASRSSLDKTADAVLELARSGMTLERLEAVIPEPPEKVRAALEELVELDVLRPR